MNVPEEKQALFAPILEELSVELYEMDTLQKKNEQKRKKTNWISLITVLSLFCIAAVVFYLSLPNQFTAWKIFYVVLRLLGTIILTTFLAVGASSFIRASIGKRQNSYHQLFREKVIKKMLQYRYPKFQYNYRQKMQDAQLRISKRFKEYQKLMISQSKSYLEGYVDNIHVILSDTKVKGKGLSTQKYGGSDQVIFSGILLYLDSGQSAENSRTALQSEQLKSAFIDLQQFWKAHITYSVAANGIVLVEVEFKAKTFLHPPTKKIRDKKLPALYNPQYTHQLNQEIDLFMRIPQLLTIQFNAMESSKIDIEEDDNIILNRPLNEDKQE